MPFTPFTPIVIGSLNWGAPLNSALQEHDRGFNAAVAGDHNLISWNIPIGALSGSSGPTSGTVVTAKLFLRQPATVSNVCIAIGAAGVTLTAGQNFAGIYNTAGLLLGTTADQSAVWNSAGFKQMALTAPVALAAGAYYVAILSNAATPPTLARGGTITASVANANLTATDAAWATGPAAQTTLPASITMASRTLSSLTTWVGVS